MKKIIMAGLIGLFFAHGVQGAISSVASGSWTNSAIWQGGSVPPDGSTVYIQGHSVTSTVPAALSVLAPLHADAVLRLENGAELTVTNTMVMNGGMVIIGAGGGLSKISGTDYVHIPRDSNKTSELRVEGGSFHSSRPIFLGAQQNDIGARGTIRVSAGSFVCSNQFIFGGGSNSVAEFFITGGTAQFNYINFDQDNGGPQGDLGQTEEVTVDGGALILTTSNQDSSLQFAGDYSKLFYESGSITWKGVDTETEFNAFTNTFNGWVDAGNVTSTVHSASELKSMLWFIGSDAVLEEVPAIGTLQGQWLLDDGGGTVAADSSGYGADMVLDRGTAVWLTDDPTYGTGFSFDGSQRFTVPAGSFAFDMSKDFILSMTVLADSANPTATFFGRYSNEAWSSGGKVFGIEDGKLRFGAYGIGSLTGFTSILDDQFHDVSVEFEAATGTLTIYLDGTMDGQSSGFGAMATIHDNFDAHIGAHIVLGNGGLYKPFSGIMRDVRISNNRATLYVATDGNDRWSGRFPVPTGDDGPLATLAGAQGRIRQIKTAGLAGGSTVLVRGGTYYESSTLVLEPQDSGTAAEPMIYKAYDGETPVFSGGRKLGTPSLNPDGSYSVMVPEAAGRAWAFRQLFIDDDRYTLARSPNTGYYTVKDIPPEPASPYYGEPYWYCHEFIFHPGDLQNWSTLASNDVTLRVYALWDDQTIYLTSVDEANHIAFTETHALRGYTPSVENSAGGMSKRYVVENAPGSMDAPGEWQLDRESGLLTAIPFEAEDLSAKTWVAPVTQVALTVAGNADTNRFVEHIRFEGLSFRHYATPVLNAGKSGGWRSNQAATGIPACIDVAGGRHIEFKRCELAHIGMHGIEFGRGCVSNTVEQCHLHDLGGAGIYLGELKRTAEGYDPGTYGATYGNTIYNNYIHDGGIIHQASAGFMIGQSYENRVAHNEIGYFNWSGIQVGWNWDNAAAWSKDNVLEYNYIHDIGQNVLSDLAAIYTVGENLNTVIRGNVMHDIFTWTQGSGKGLYPDQKTEGVTFSENLVFNAGAHAFGINFCDNIVVSNNIFAMSYGEAPFNLGFGRLSAPVWITRNIFYYYYGNVYCEKDETITPSELSPCDYNLYWRIGGGPVLFQRPGDDPVDTVDFAGWQSQSGKDAHSLVADPMFMDPDNGDFSFRDPANAQAIGFQPVDWSKAGLEGDPAWVALPEGFQRESQYAVYGEARPVYFTPDTADTLLSSELSFVEGSGQAYGGMRIERINIPSGTNFEVRVTDDLLSGDWTVLTNVVPDGANGIVKSLIIQDDEPVHSSTSRFYRVFVD